MVIVGGGPAGLSAALVLARCRRRIVVCDEGKPRNAAAQALHGFFTRDGERPGELLRLGREEIGRYGIEVLPGRAVSAARCETGFEVVLEDGRGLRSRRLLLATGVVDVLPRIPGFREYYGKGVHHCPYCDGWEARDRPLAAYGRGPAAAGLALSLKTWSSDVALLTDGPARLQAAEIDRLNRNGVSIWPAPVALLEGSEDGLERIVFRTGETLDRRAVFFNTGQRQRSDLALQLGCRFTNKGVVRTTSKKGTNIPGLYVAGDASRDVQMVIVAAAEGVKAAVDINKSFQAEET